MSGDGPGPTEEDLSSQEYADLQARRDRDPVASLRDSESEAGDEDEITDDFDIDRREASELGVDLDDGYDDEPRLD